MHSPDYEIVAEYITSLTGNIETPVAWQLIFDPDKSHRDNPNFTASLNQAWPTILDAQSKKYGVFICVNQTDGLGRKIENMTGVRAVFADWDDQDQPVWTLTPHFVCKRSERRGHAYWLLSNGQLNEFSELQKRISLQFDTDPSITNLDRVMRVPGTWHFKNPAMPELYQFEYNAVAQLPKYSSDDIRNTFTLDAPREAELFKWVSRSAAKNDGLDELEDEPQAVASYIGYLRTCPVAIDGSGTAQQTVISTASVGWDYGLTPEKTQELMYEHYNPRCEPIWSTPADIRLFDRLISNAYRFAKNAPGCRSAKGVFNAHLERTFNGEIPAPTEGWEANKAIKPKASNVPTITQEVVTQQDDGSFLQLSITNKTNPWDKARAFLQSKYPQGRLIHTDKVYFTFDGTVWVECEDDDLDADMAMFYEHLKLPPPQIKGILDSTRRMSHKAGLEQNTWLNDGSNAHSVLVFKNGIVDISDAAPVLKAHTHELFTTNALNYEYNPAAGCPEWLKFLETIWSDDHELKLQLQEWMGYLLTRDNSYQKFALFKGKPRAGKGTITNVIELLVGQFNCSAPSLEDLTKDSILDSMSKKQVAIIPDAHSVSHMKRDQVLGTLKAIIGGDSRSFDRKFKKAATAKFHTRFVLSANDMPSFKDPSGALAARMLVFPFTRSFVGREDRELKDRLAGEMQGIANWAIEGLQRLRVNRRFTEAASGLEQLEIVQDDMFQLGPFVTDCLSVEQDTRTAVSDIYAAYLAWCMTEGIKLPLSKRAVSKELSASPLPIAQCKMVDGKRPRGFIGIRVNDEWQNRLGSPNISNFPAIPPALGDQHESVTDTHPTYIPVN